MQIKLDRIAFINEFLMPLNKIVGDDDINKGCIIDITNQSASSICNTKDNSIILYANMNISTGLDEKGETHLNIFDIREFIRLLECIQENEVLLKINSNNLTYKSNNINFKFHLMDDGVIRKSPINVAKISNLTFQNEFSMSKSKLDELMRVSGFAEDSNKLYLSCVNNGIRGELTDKTKPNIDNVDIQIAESYIGNNFNNIPISLDVFRKLSGIKFDLINIKVNVETKILLMELISNNCVLKYVASALVK